MVSLSNCVFANQDGDGTTVSAISGSVSDAFSKKPVKGVTVYVTAKDGTKLITTDASGKFVIPKLPAGEVTIQLEKKGYKTYRREKVYFGVVAYVKAAAFALHFGVAADE